jgi:glycosyltransferase involved in cell wall biosynthesis
VTDQSAVLLMPRASTEWAGAAALWITAAGWAGAAERRFGASWVVTPDAVASAATTLTYTRHQVTASTATRRRRGLEVLARTAVKDVREARRSRRRAHVEHGPWDDTDVVLVWQHHDLFHRAGVGLASSLGVPLVSFVHAPQVWEAAKWGVRRPGWGRLVERYGEAPQLRASDVVACVSDDVAAELSRFGVPDDRIVVTPMAVDADRFSPEVSGEAVRREYGLGDEFVIGWTGSFRGFHGLDLALRAFADVSASLPTARLLLVGEGAERASMEALAAELGIADRVVFTGGVSNEQVPEMVAAMDVALVTARPGDDFHYSPLKMREYMACGKAVVAPNVGEIPTFVHDGVSGLLYDPGLDGDLAARLLIAGRDDARHLLGEHARDVILERGTWDVQLERVLSSPGFSHPRAR